MAPTLLSSKLKATVQLLARFFTLACQQTFAAWARKITPLPVNPPKKTPTPEIPLVNYYGYF